MLNKLLPLVLMFAAVCGMAGASSLYIDASGQFSGSDSADALVAPNGIFNISFIVSSNPTVSNVTSLGFDVPVAAFSYTLNNVAIIVAPSEIRFNTSANGGLFDITIGTGLNAEEFDFEGSQAFTGTTAAPVFAAGALAVTDIVYSDSLNYDPIAAGTASITPTPEPSAVFLASCGLLVLAGRKFRAL